MKLDDKVWQEGIKNGFWNANSKVLVACSGGVDSMVLLEIFYLWSQRNNIQVAAIHCNHQLRGNESDQDASAVEEWCNKKNIPIIVERLSVTQCKEQEGGNIEEIARQLRYQAIEIAAKDIDADVVVLGHHQDDQAETVLLHLFRGSGNFKGMKERRGIFLRPLLSFSKEEIYKFAQENEIPYWEDSTNKDTDFRRNWIRSELLPLLRENINLEVEAALGRWAKLTNDDIEFWDKYCQEWCNRFGRNEVSGFSIPLEAFNQLTIAEARRIIRTVLLLACDNLRGIELTHVESLVKLANRNIGNSLISLPGHWQGRVFQKRLYIESVIIEEENDRL